MSKIMLAEDDDSLREIYSIRLTAEGYEVITARDGEEALAIAVKERPDLVISDVMMPKISGFDMLDILRSTPTTQDVKVIMMTALSTEDQRARGESLGADRYLVKSQVGIEDVVNAVHEVLGDRTADGVILASATTPEVQPVSAEVAQVTVTPVTQPAAVPVQPVVPAQPLSGSLNQPTTSPMTGPLNQPVVTQPATTPAVAGPLNQPVLPEQPPVSA